MLHENNIKKKLDLSHNYAHLMKKKVNQTIRVNNYRIELLQILQQCIIEFFKQVGSR